MSNQRKTVIQPESLQDLPDDASLLKEMLWQVLQSNDDLVQQVAFLKRALFGKKSERFISDDQLELFKAVLETLAQGEASADDSKNDSKNDAGSKRMPKDKAKTSRGGKRDKKRGNFLGGTVPKDTPVDTTHVRLDGAKCPVCGDLLCVLGTDSRMRVGFHPGHFYVQETVVETGICPNHPRESLHTPQGPDFIVTGGVMANGLLNKVVVDKFADGLPLNRQCARFKRKGVRIGSSTLSRNVIAHAALGKHLVNAMRDELVKSDWLQGDATGLPILIGTLGQAHQGQLWVYSNGESAVFQASMTKHGKIPSTFLEGFAGVWLCDGASNYNDVARKEGVERAGCWSHGRRYVFDARNDNIAAYVGLQLIRDLFMGERTAMLLSHPDRLEHRTIHAAPIIEKIRAWISQHRTSDHVVKRPKSAFAKAINYLHNQWATLILFLQRAEIPVHNNRSELLLRTPVIGRRAWLFAGSPEGADASAIQFSLMASCMLQGINPDRYLNDVMPSLGSKTKNEIAELTPARWAERRRAIAGTTNDI